MPVMRIVAVDGTRITVEGSTALQAEIDRYEAALDALVPALEGEDDEAGNAALVRYNVLAGGLNQIITQLPSWDEVVASEQRDKRKALARQVRARRAAEKRAS